MKDAPKSPHASIQPEFVQLKKAAEQLAHRRREPLCSFHLLLAIAEDPSPARDLLVERRLGSEELQLAARGMAPLVEESLKQTLLRSREIMVRMNSTSPTAVHVLIALLGDRRAAAYRALETCGADVGRLRSALMNLGLGLSTPRKPRLSATEAPETPPAAALLPPSRPPRGVTIPLFPPTSSTAQRTPANARRRAPTPAQIVPLRPVPKPRANVERAPSAVAQVERAPSAQAAQAPSAAAATSAPESRQNPQRFELDPQKYPTLCAFGKNLTVLAARAAVDPVVGRRIEIEQMLDVLAKREGNNPCLVGGAGVGKTSVVRGLAQRIVEGVGLGPLDDKIVIEVPVGELLAGTGVRGALASRLAAVRKEVLASGGRVVLFFDEIHQLFTGDGADEISGDLKLALARGELPCIGATTTEEYRRAIEVDAALARRFTAIEVDEPSREEAFLILSAIAEKLEAHHQLRYAEEALALTVAWSVRYLPGRALPDKAVSIIDLAGARARRRGGLEVTREAVAEVVAELANMPIERLLETDADRYLRLEDMLADRVVGHGAQIGRIARILRRNAAGLGARRPLGTFLLLGPTGVGKTETAKAIAEVLFFDESAMTRIDMSEYSEPHAVAKLIGAPPGYVGHDAGGQLTEAVRRRPYQVVLLDEIEKAHTDVLTAFLALFDEGRLTDGRGRTVDFTNTVIILTSNLGAEQAATTGKRRVGFGTSNNSDDDLEQRITAVARGSLAPELYNRIDEVLVFGALGRDEVREVARRMLGALSATLTQQRGISLEVETQALELLMDEGGYDPALGARPMRRTIARLLEAPLAERILRGELPSGAKVRVLARRGQLCFELESAKHGRAARLH